MRQLRGIDDRTGLEKRPRTVQHCPHLGCDWVLVTSWFLGGPHRIREVPGHEQQFFAGQHMRTHYPPPRIHIT